MAAPSRSPASWERVLAAIEADAARAAALLASDDVMASAGIEYDDPNSPVSPPPLTDVPATWRLPDPTPNAGTMAAGSAHLVNSARSSFAATSVATAPGADEALPDPAELPPLNPEVRAHLEALQERINLLQGELGAAMAEAEAIMATQPAQRRGPVSAPPELVDRRL